MLHDAPVAPVYQKGEAHLTNPQVKGLQYHKIGPDTTLKHVYIDKSIDRETGKRKITKIRPRVIYLYSWSFIMIYLLRPKPIARSIFSMF